MGILMPGYETIAVCTSGCGELKIPMCFTGDPDRVAIGHVKIHQDHIVQIYNRITRVELNPVRFYDIRSKECAS